MIMIIVVVIITVIVIVIVIVIIIIIIIIIMVEFGGETRFICDFRLIVIIVLNAFLSFV